MAFHCCAFTCAAVGACVGIVDARCCCVRDALGGGGAPWYREAVVGGVDILWTCVGWLVEWVGSRGMQ